LKLLRYVLCGVLLLVGYGIPITFLAGLGYILDIRNNPTAFRIIVMLAGLAMSYGFLILIARCFDYVPFLIRFAAWLDPSQEKTAQQMLLEARSRLSDEIERLEEQQSSQT
jgi:hypothetical protein